MDSELYSRLFCMRPVNGLLAVDLTLIAEFMGDETVETVRTMLEELGFHTLPKHCVEAQIPLIQSVAKRSRYVIHAAPMAMQPNDLTFYQFDCSSFTQWCAALLGFNLPRRSVEQFLAPVGELLKDTVDLELFDIVFTTTGLQGGWNTRGFHYSCNENDLTIGHCGLVIGPDQIIHAADSKTGIVVSSLDSFLSDSKGQRKPLRGIRRLFTSGHTIVPMLVPPALGITTAADVPVHIRLHYARKIWKTA